MITNTKVMVKKSHVPSTQLQFYNFLIAILCSLQLFLFSFSSQVIPIIFSNSKPSCLHL